MELDITVPDALKDLKGWLVWKLVDREGIKKPLKLPFYVGGQPRSGEQGSVDDRSSLTDFTTAIAYAKKHSYTGVGLAMMPEWGVTALDFDNCINDLTGDIDPTVLSAIDGTYAEISPSGNGIRAFVTGSYGNSKSLSKDNAFGLELFTSKGYVTFTGDVVNACAIDAVSSAGLALIRSRFSITERTTTTFTNHSIDLSDLAKALSYLDSSMSYPEWVQIGMAIHFESNGTEEGFQLWDAWSEKADNYPDEYTLRDKWASFDSVGKTPITGRTILNMARQNGMQEEVAFTPLNDEVSNFYNIRPVGIFMVEYKPAEWIIKDVLPKAGLGIIYGESGAGKSFIALDMCASISRQAPWNEIKTQLPNAKVLYVVAEGASGFSKRIKAYCDANFIQPSSLNIDIISDVTPNLIDGISVDHLVRDMESHGPYDIIVMDTFAQVTPGANENSGEDMGKALNYCKRIHAATGAMVMLVHHSGKDASKGARGHSSLVAAADVIISVTREEEDRKLKVIKMKDGDDMREFGFKLAPYITGTDAEGDDITSCVVEYCDIIDSGDTKLRPIQKAVYEAMQMFSSSAWVSQDHLIDIAIEHVPLKEGARDQRRTVVKRTIKAMIGVWLFENENHEVKLKITQENNKVL